MPPLLNQLIVPLISLRCRSVWPFLSKAMQGLCLKERHGTIYVLDEEKVSNKVVYSMIYSELFVHPDEI